MFSLFVTPSLAGHFFLYYFSMLRSHFIPQFILRAFCEGDKIQYMDLASKNVESRNPRSVFSEDGYYPEQLEHELCDKIERNFAPVHKKIISSRYKMILDANEMFLLKKYLLVASLRIKSDELKQISTEDFFKNVEAALNCSTKDDFNRLMFNAKLKSNLILEEFFKHIVGSYTIFIKTSHSKIDFVIPDSGSANYIGAYQDKKFEIINGMINMVPIPLFYDIKVKMTKHDYTIFPLSKNTAVLCVNPFYKLLVGKPLTSNSIPHVFGFGNTELIQDAKVGFNPNGTIKDYTFDIKQLSRQDTCFLNHLMLTNAESHIAFANREKIGIEL